MSDERRFNRRNFFRSGLRELLKPVADAVDAKLDELSNLPPVRRRAVSLNLLRPPGALPEAEFLSTCSRCGACVNACPAKAIVIDANLADGAPHIDASRAACVVCSTLECMLVCPSGALVPTPMRLIDMGTARWIEPTCRRSSGEDCQICLDACPIGEVAVRLDGNRVQVVEDGCVGCGLCQQKCPTSSKSIVVDPRL